MSLDKDDSAIFPKNTTELSNPVLSDIAGTTDTPNKLNREDDSRPFEKQLKSKSIAAKAVLAIVALVAFFIFFYFYRKQIMTALNKIFNPKKKDDEK